MLLLLPSQKSKPQVLLAHVLPSLAPHFLVSCLGLGPALSCCGLSLQLAHCPSPALPRSPPCCLTQCLLLHPFLDLTLLAALPAGPLGSQPPHHRLLLPGPHKGWNQDLSPSQCPPLGCGPLLLGPLRLTQHRERHAPRSPEVKPLRHSPFAWFRFH